MDIENTACKTCDKTFDKRAHLFSHFRKIHNDYTKPYYPWKRWAFKCMDGCDVSYKQRQGLENHLANVHKYVIKKTQLFFQSMKDFRAWLKMLEKLKLFYTIHKQRDFLLMRKHKVSSCYQCTAPSEILKRGPKPKKPKFAGCTSYMEVEELCDEVYATISDFHYGHEPTVRKLPFPYFSERIDDAAQGSGSTGSAESQSDSKQSGKPGKKAKGSSKAPTTKKKKKQGKKRSARRQHKIVEKLPKLTTEEEEQIITKWPTAEDFGKFVTAELRQIDKLHHNKVKSYINSALKKHFEI